MSFQTRVVVGFIAACLVIPAIWLMIPTAQARKVNRMKIITPSLPMGLTKEQVASLCAIEGVPSVYQSVDENSTGDSAVTDFGFTPADLSGFTVAYVHGTPRTIIGQCSVYFNFYFDKKGKLIKVINQKRCIGL